MEDVMEITVQGYYLCALCKVIQTDGTCWRLFKDILVVEDRRQICIGVSPMFVVLSTKVFQH